MCSRCYSSARVNRKEKYFLQPAKHHLNSCRSGQNTEKGEYELTIEVYENSPDAGIVTGKKNAWMSWVQGGFIYATGFSGIYWFLAHEEDRF